MTSELAPGKPKTRGSYAKTDQKRRMILDAALEVFAESGYRSGSIREVAERVGMSEAGLLHHFPNKSALLARVLERRDDQTVEIFNIGLGPDGQSTISAILALADYNASVPGVVELYCTLSAEATTPDHPAHEYFRERYVYSRGVIEKGFLELEQAGLLAPGVVPASASRRTLALMDGLQVQWLLDRSSLDMTEELRAFFQGLVTYQVTLPPAHVHRP